VILKKVPNSVGNCDLVKKFEVQEAYPHPGQDCKHVTIPSFTIPALNVVCSVLFVDGIHSLKLDEMVVTPEATASTGLVPGPNGQFQPNEQRWGLRVSAHFTNLKVFLFAEKNGNTWINGPVCCKGNYHLMLQTSVVCSDELGFFGNVSVDKFRIDPIHFSQISTYNPRPSTSSEEIFQVDLGSSVDMITDAVKKKIEVMIVKKTGGTSPGPHGAPPFILTKTLNQFMSYNKGRRCPRLT